MPPGTGHQRTVSVVDDDEWIHEMPTKARENERYPIVTTSDGREALDLVEPQRRDQIVLDRMMPTLNGPAFADELRRRGLHPGIPIVVLTADRNARGEAKWIGAVGYLGKPIDAPRLLDQITRLTRP